MTNEVSRKTDKLGPPMQPQITFKVSPELHAALEEQAQRRHISANVFARELVEQALSQSLTGNHLDEFRELVGQLRQQMTRLGETQPASSSTASETPMPSSLLELPGQVARLIDTLGEKDAFAKELRDLREQIARMMAVLHRYAAGDPPAEDAAQFGKQIFERK